MPERTQAKGRLHARILRHGADQLSDAELVAVALGIGAGDTTEFAHELLTTTGSLQRLLRASPEEIGRITGIGAARSARLKAIVELGRRYMAGPVNRGRALNRPQDAASCFRARLGDLSYEVFGCLYLDTRHRIICYEPLFRGTVDGATVYPREVLKRALHHNAAALILGHNHPSGDCEPSEADRSITRRISKALALVDIRLLDHIVVTVDGHTSLAERGWV